MRELMSPPKMIPEPDRTRSRIMEESVRMFALSGYHAVSIRDIAAAIGIRPATIYAHFASKEDIMANIMVLCEAAVRQFYQMLDRLSEEASGFKELLDNIFVETKEMVNPPAFYGVYCALVNQFELACCRHVYYDVYFWEGHMTMRRQLETAIRRGLVEPFDVVEIATQMTNCFLAMDSFAVARFNGYYQDFNLSEWYERQIQHILRCTRAAE